MRVTKGLLRAKPHNRIQMRVSGLNDHMDKEIADALLKFAQGSQFRRACMSMMAWSLTNDERAQVQDAFLEMDKSHGGTITLGDFKKILEDQFDMPDSDVKNAFHALDIAHTEEIHYSDFLAAMVSTRIQLHDDLLRQTFRRFDNHNTGYITSRDLEEILGQSFEGTNAEAMIREVNKSGDGKISYQEFIDYLKGGEAEEKHVEAANRIIDEELQKTESRSETPKTPHSRERSNRLKLTARFPRSVQE